MSDINKKKWAYCKEIGSDSIVGLDSCDDYKDWLSKLDSKSKVKPNILQPVLALILHHGELGISSWHEVVTFNEKGWVSYAGSNTFEDGEYVVKWKYIADIEF
jgi:hypothetical protein